jgi:hypothetical protein
MRRKGEFITFEGSLLGEEELKHSPDLLIYLLSIGTS